MTYISCKKRLPRSITQSNKNNLISKLSIKNSSKQKKSKKNCKYKLRRLKLAKNNNIWKNKSKKREKNKYFSIIGPPSTRIIQQNHRIIPQKNKRSRVMNQLNQNLLLKRPLHQPVKERPLNLLRKKNHCQKSRVWKIKSMRTPRRENTNLQLYFFSKTILSRIASRTTQRCWRSWSKNWSKTRRNWIRMMIERLNLLWLQYIRFC